MNPIVRQFMNPTLVYLPEGTRLEIARNFVLKFGITAVPVLNDAQQPVGTVSLRDLDDTRSGYPRVAGPAVTVQDDATIESAGRTLARANAHQLVVVDKQGRAVGMLSALDVIRALIGLEPHHPKAIDAVR